MVYFGEVLRMSRYLVVRLTSSIPSKSGGRERSVPCFTFGMASGFERRQYDTPLVFLYMRSCSHLTIAYPLLLVQGHWLQGFLQSLDHVHFWHFSLFESKIWRRQPTKESPFEENIRSTNSQNILYVY
jgi:hypothetical protein